MRRNAEEQGKGQAARAELLEMRSLFSHRYWVPHMTSSTRHKGERGGVEYGDRQCDS